MPEAYLAVAVVGALLVANVFWPARRIPFSAGSFLAGWLTGELAFQHIVWQVLATGLFAWGGAFSAWPGWLGLAIAVADWAALAWIGMEGHRARRVVAAALATPSTQPLADAARRADPHTAWPAPDPPAARWCRPWRRAVALPVGRHGVERISGIDYWGDGRARHRLDILRRRPDPPAGADGADGTSGADGAGGAGGADSTSGAPVLVQIHGGAWTIGDKREQGIPLMRELVARGWLCVAINYRLSPRATWPEHIVDVKRAIAWVRQHIAEYGGDPRRIALSGGSAGGHLAALTALTANDPAWQPGFAGLDTSVMACVPFYGVYDMRPAAAQPAEPTNRSGPATAQPAGPTNRPTEVPGLRRLLENRVMKVPVDGHEQLFADASPTTRVHADAPPFFVFHGTRDTVVPVAQARELVAALNERSSAPVAYAELPRAQHAFEVLVSPRSWASTAGAVAFLDAVATTATTATTDRDSRHHGGHHGGLHGGHHGGLHGGLHGGPDLT